uniref:Uncharacterized protein n=1 Tax=Globodera rostochiensis TaxID=31243 RepID=A0A914HTB7_GLORO
MIRRLVNRAFDTFKGRLGAHDLPFLRGFILGFNYYDEARVRQFGADRVAAEWVVRCEGKAKFDCFSHIISDYNALQRFASELDPKKESDQLHLITIDATDSCVSGWGCRHFVGLRHLQNVRFVRCKMLTDNGLEMLANSTVSDTLQSLHIESCPKVTNSGLRHLRKLKMLKSLSLQHLKNVWKPKTVLEEIKAGIVNAFGQMGVPTIFFVTLFFTTLLLLNAFLFVHGEGEDGGAGVASGEGRGCPPGCICAEGSLECGGFDLETIPHWWPTHFERIVLRNWTMSTIDKNAFRRFQQLRELHLLDCPRLDLIERHAFKQLRKLRLLVIRGNKSLRELHKASFSAIGNELSLSVQIADNAIERIRAFAFKNAQNLRELFVEERCFELEGCALGAISRLDFLTLHGPFAFQNSTLIHQLHITGSSLSKLPRNGFAELSYISQLQIRECRIGRVDEGALGGLFTVGSVHLQSNQIVRLSPGWSNGMDNIGKLVFTYNTVREPMASTDCLRHEGAQRFEFADNTLHCSCALQWMINAPEEEQWLAENYCGPEENFKALLYFSPAAAGCAPWMPPPPLLVPSPAAPLPPRPSSSPSSGLPDRWAHQQPSDAGEWSNEEDEPFPDPSPHRRHSSQCPRRLSTILERFDGRDKTIRSLYFTFVLIANRLRDQRKADQLMAFARQFSRTRLICRMFSQPSLLLSVLRIPRAFRLSRDRVDCTLASSISVLYLFCGWTELIGLLTESGFVGRTTAHSLRHFGSALRLWVLALALSIIRCLRQIVRRTAANGLTWRKSDREWLKTQLISLVGSSADFVAVVNSLPRGMLWAGKMLPSHCASLHLAASFVGVFKQFM